MVPEELNGTLRDEIAPQSLEAIQSLQSLVKKLRKTDPQSAKKLQKKLKKKKNKINHQIKEINNENAKIKTKEEKQNERRDEKGEKGDESEEEDENIGVDVEYILQPLEALTEENKVAEEFLEVFEKFRFGEKEVEEEEKKLDFKDDEKVKEKGDSDEEDEENDGKPKISKKKLKQMSRFSLAHLKQLAARPDVVEVYDCTASDALFLIYLKACRNTVPVPVHWSHKRKYMQGKRGIEKPPFKLPSYIEATKISEIRQAIQEKDAQKSVKQKQREKVRPKMHRMDIDYQVLHDAFFKYATKPKLTKFGDIYYEGKENELKMRKFKPGCLTDTLRAAVGMGNNAPPPWLINMQRYGPPPRYPNLKIPGLNSPIPVGAEYGFHAGGWGKPPVDEFGNPLYGDFALDSREEVNTMDGPLWGELASDHEDEDDEEEENAQPGDGEGTKTPASMMGMDTPSRLGMVTETSGLRSIGSRTSGEDTPESVDIRKRGINTVTPKPYTILQQQQAPAQPGALFASNITYKIPSNVQMQGHVTPIGGMATPGGTVTPGVGGLVTPYGGGVTPYGGGVTPYGGGVTPYIGGVATPFAGGLVTPYGSGNISVGGVVTPSLVPGVGGVTSVVGGLQTPVGKTGAGGVTVALNPSEMEQEGVFAADVIRQQLKQHEEASSRVKKAAGQVDPHDARKRKGESTTDGVSKKKKKEKFKF